MYSHKYTEHRINSCQLYFKIVLLKCKQLWNDTPGSAGVQRNWRRICSSEAGVNSIFQKVAKVSQCCFWFWMLVWFCLVLCYSDLMNDITLMLAEWKSQNWVVFANATNFRPSSNKLCTQFLNQNTDAAPGPNIIIQLCVFKYVHVFKEGWKSMYT